jgi:hypothetical protein
MRKKYLYSFYTLAAIIDNNNKWCSCPICNKDMFFKEKQFAIHNNKTGEDIGSTYCSRDCAQFGLLQEME